MLLDASRFVLSCILLAGGLLTCVVESGCASHAGGPDPSPANENPAVAPEVPGAYSHATALPDVAELPRNAASTLTDRYREGDSFFISLPFRGVKLHLDGGSHTVPSLDFDPSYKSIVDPQTGPECAYAIYLFNLPGYDNANVINLQWEQAPQQHTKVWIALANWRAERWDWFSVGPDFTVALDSLAAYTDQGSGADFMRAPLYLGVFVEPGNTGVLSGIRLGEAVEQDWSEQVVYTLPSGGGYFEAIRTCLDAAEDPCLLYIIERTEMQEDRRYNCMDLCYATYKDSQWESAVLDTVSFLTGNVVDPMFWLDVNPQLVLDSDGVAHICYSEIYEPTHNQGPAAVSIYYGSNAGGSWDIQLVDGCEAWQSAAALALDSLRQPHIAYFQPADEQFKFASYVSGAWSKESIGWGDALAGGYAFHQVALAITPQDQPYVYCLNDGGYVLAFTEKAGSWTCDYVGDTSMDAAAALPLTAGVDSLGTPFICYWVSTSELLSQHLVMNKWSESIGDPWPEIADFGFASKPMAAFAALDASDSLHLLVQFGKDPDSGESLVVNYLQSPLAGQGAFYESIARKVGVVSNPALDSGGRVHFFRSNAAGQLVYAYRDRE